MNESDSDLKNLKNRFIYWGLAWDANGLGKSIDGRCRRSSQPENSIFNLGTQLYTNTAFGGSNIYIIMFGNINDMGLPDAILRSSALQPTSKV